MVRFRFKGERVLVTGAGGFIGSHLVERLVYEGAEVRAVIHYNSRNDQGNLSFLSPEIRERIEIRMLDITDPFTVRSAIEGCACVFHLAALIGIPYSYTAPAAYVDVNIRGTLNVLEAARQCETPKIVHTSTSETYGTARYTPIDENHSLQGQSPYSATKIAADKLAESYWSSFGLPVTTLRPFNTFGPRQSARAVIPAIISQLLREDKVQLGSTTPVRDFTYVTDTVAAFIAVAQCDAAVGTVCNAGNGKGITIGEIAQRLIDLINPRAKLTFDPDRVRPENSEVMALLADYNRIQQLTGWRPKVGLTEGLTSVITFMKQHLDLFRHNDYVI